MAGIEPATNCDRVGDRLQAGLLLHTGPLPLACPKDLGDPSQRSLGGTAPVGRQVLTMTPTAGDAVGNPCPKRPRQRTGFRQETYWRQS